MNQFHPTITRNGRSIGWLTSGDRIYLASAVPPDQESIGLFVPDVLIGMQQAYIDGRLQFFETFELTPETAARLKQLADDIIQLIYDIPKERQLELMLSSSRALERSE